MSEHQLTLFPSLDTETPLDLIQYTYRSLGNNRYEVCNGKARVVIDSDSEEMETILTNGARQLMH